MRAAETTCIRTTRSYPAVSTAVLFTSADVEATAVASVEIALEVRKFCMGGVLGYGSGYFLAPAGCRGLAAANAAVSVERTAADSSAAVNGSNTPLASHARPMTSGTVSGPYTSPATDTSVPAA